MKQYFNRQPCQRTTKHVVLQDFNEPSTSVLRKVFSTCIALAKYYEWKEPDVAAAEERVEKVLEENRENQEHIEVLRREYDMACNDQEDKELVRINSLAPSSSAAYLRKVSLNSHAVMRGLNTRGTRCITVWYKILSVDAVSKQAESRVFGGLASWPVSFFQRSCKIKQNLFREKGMQAQEYRYHYPTGSDRVAYSVALQKKFCHTHNTFS